MPSANVHTDAPVTRHTETGCTNLHTQCGRSDNRWQRDCQPRPWRRDFCAGLPASTARQRRQQRARDGHPPADGTHSKALCHGKPVTHTVTMAGMQAGPLCLDPWRQTRATCAQRRQQRSAHRRCRAAAVCIGDFSLVSAVRFTCLPVRFGTGSTARLDGVTVGVAVGVAAVSGTT